MGAVRRAAGADDGDAVGVVAAIAMFVVGCGIAA